jgi:hypothetical protein
MRKHKVALVVRCNWVRRKKERDVYDCPNCGCWTANLPLYKETVCSAKERRKNKADRRWPNR